VNVLEEKNITNQTNEVKQTKPAPQAKTAKAAKKGNDKDTFADYKAEFKKIVWPARPEVVKKTATVVVTSLIIGAIIFCMDTVFNAGYGVIIGLLG
jgi:preprotein translocase subunit SecE